MRKYHFIVVAGLVGAIIACSMVKTRDEAKEAAKIQATEAESATLPAGPVMAENENGENLDQAAPEAAPGAPVATPTPSDDPVLDEELSKMGIDPNDPEGTQNKTPEPGAAPAPNAVPLQKRTVFKQQAKAKPVVKKSAPTKTTAKAKAKTKKTVKAAKKDSTKKDSKVVKKKKPVKPKPQAG